MLMSLDKFFVQEMQKMALMLTLSNCRKYILRREKIMLKKLLNVNG